MNKERIKSLALALLVMMNFVLGGKILTDEKLWPYGYNFFLSLKNSEFLKAITNSTDRKITKAHLTKPEQIIVNTGDQTSRIAIKPNDEIFSEISIAADELISEALKNEAKNIFFAPKSEWVSVLGGKSVCLNYAVPYNTKLFGEFFGADTSVLSSFVQSFARIVITEERAVYFEDFKTGNFYKTESRHNSDRLVSIINKTRSLYRENDKIINYAVDLKFDEAFGSQKAVLSPAVPVYSTSVKLPGLTPVNPLKNAGGDFDRDIIDEILPVFKINAGNVRRYSEVDGTMVFVENNGILKIHPDGELYYQSTDSNGFYLSSGESYTETVSALADLADRVNAACMEKCDLYLSDTLTVDGETVTFDYRAEGIPVNIDNDGRHRNAVTAEIKGGSLTSYRQILKNYIPCGEFYETSAYIEALDSAIEEYVHNMNNIEIQKVFLSYSDNGESPIKADWETKVKSIVINKEDMK